LPISVALFAVPAPPAAGIETIIDGRAGLASAVDSKRKNLVLSISVN
jgi:hypothetical protein